MYRNILVPLDGSSTAESALPLAARLARSAQARLHVMLVHEPTAALASAGALPPPPPELDAAMHAREEAYLEGVASRWRDSAGTPVECHLVEGQAGPDVCAEAARLEADLLVMTTHGRGAFRRLWLGSVADYVVRHLAIPVLLLPRRALADSADHSTLRHLLVALDLSQASETVLSQVKTLAALTGADVTLVYVAAGRAGVTDFETAGPMEQAFPAERLVDYASRRLEQLAAVLRAQNLRVTSRVVVARGAADGLLEALEQDGCDLIALTTHGAGGLRRMVLGSIADRVVRGATKPVLVLRPPKET